MRAALVAAMCLVASSAVAANEEVDVSEVKAFTPEEQARVDAAAEQGRERQRREGDELDRRIRALECVGLTHDIGFFPEDSVHLSASLTHERRAVFEADWSFAALSWRCVRGHDPDLAVIIDWTYPEAEHQLAAGIGLDVLTEARPFVRLTAGAFIRRRVPLTLHVDAGSLLAPNVRGIGFFAGASVSLFSVGVRYEITAKRQSTLFTFGVRDPLRNFVRLLGI